MVNMAPTRVCVIVVPRGRELSIELTVLNRMCRTSVLAERASLTHFEVSTSGHRSRVESSVCGWSN
jgi:hypothetical protein